MPMRLVLVLMAATLLLLGCKIPGLDQIDQKITTLTDRIDEIEEMAGDSSDIDLAAMDQRLQGIEDILGDQGLDEEAATGLIEAIDTIDSLKIGMAGMELAFRAGRDSLAEAYGMLSESEVLVDSLFDRIDDLEGQIATLRTTQSSGTPASGGSVRGSGGGTSGGRTGSGSGSGSGSGGGSTTR